MDKQEFFYNLPENKIANFPAKDRDGSKLLYLNGQTQTMEDLVFRQLPQLLVEGDCLVINDSKVIPARLLGQTKIGGGRLEVLLLKRVEGDIWEAIVRPGRKLRPGKEIVFGQGLLEGRVLEIKEDGNRLISFNYDGLWEEVLDKVGSIPLPPYIERETTSEDKIRYQTVYAHDPGSAAAPTAGLHFTPQLLEELEAKGVNIARITLHTGLGTFRPVKSEKIEDHVMHSEYYKVSEGAADLVNTTRARGARIVAVGTTSCRVLESISSSGGTIQAGEGETDIFIYPGYHFKCVDALITNFHLPESTLIMLVSAFSGKENIMRAYGHAIDNDYRFFSFGDAMFLTPKG